MKKLTYTKGFRPLAGIMVLIWVEEYKDDIKEW